MNRLVLLAALFYGVILPSEAAAAPKEAEVCNYTGQTVYVAFGWTSYTVSIARGWFRADNYTCIDLPSEDADSLFPLYGYAVGADGSTYHPSKPSMRFCIHSKKPFRYNEIACEFADGLFGNSNKTVNTWTDFGAMSSNEIFSLQSFRWDIR